MENRQNKASEGEKNEGKDSVKGGEITDKGRKSETEAKNKKRSKRRTREQNTWGNQCSIDFLHLANSFLITKQQTFLLFKRKVKSSPKTFYCSLETL